MRISDWSSDVCSSDLTAATDRCHNHVKWRCLRQKLQGGGALPGDDAGIIERVNQGAANLVQHALGGGIACCHAWRAAMRSEEHTSELQSLMRISYAVLCLNKKHTNRCRYEDSTSSCSTASESGLNTL